jgi:hypothetical protein
MPHQPHPRNRNTGWHTELAAKRYLPLRWALAVLSAWLLLTACSDTPQPVNQGQPTTHTAPVMGYTTPTPRSVVAYDDDVGDTVLAFGDISAGQDPVLNLQLANASTIPLSRYLLLEGHLPCTPGTVQPPSLRLAIVYGVEFAPPPGPRLTLVTPTARELPDLHIAVLASTDGAIRGSCDLMSGIENIDIAFRQGWNWMRVPPRINTNGEESLSVAYMITDMTPQPPGTGAVWVDLTAWINGAFGAGSADHSSTLRYGIAP